MKYKLIEITEKNQDILDSLLGGEGTVNIVLSLKVEEIESHLDELKTQYNLKDGFVMYYFTEKLYMEHFDVPETIRQYLNFDGPRDITYVILTNIERETLKRTDLTFTDNVSYDIGVEANLNYQLVNVNSNNQDKIFEELYQDSALIISWIELLEDINMYVNVLKNRCGLHDNCIIYYFTGYSCNAYYNTNKFQYANFIAIRSSDLDNPDNIWDNIELFDKMVDETLNRG